LSGILRRFPLRRVGGVRRGGECCADMAYYLVNRCDQHTDPYDCPDVIVVKGNNGYGIPIHDGGSSFIQIKRCPWCGQRL